MANDLWKSYTINADEPPLHLALSGLHVWIQRKNEEIWIGHIHEDPAAEPAVEHAEPPEELKWSRWANRSSEEPLSITPVFPDLPIVVGPEFPMTIGSGSEIKFYTRIPVWVRIAFNKSEYVLKEIPSTPLSKTWFGTPLEGELCFWLTTKARRSLSEVESKPNVVNCPIRISNQDTEDLHFEKFCYRVGRLGIHRFNGDLWAGETKIVNHDQDTPSDITMTGKLPQDMGKGQQLSKPRYPMQSSLASRTFKRLFEDTFISAR